MICKYITIFFSFDLDLVQAFLSVVDTDGDLIFPNGDLDLNFLSLYLHLNLIFLNLDLDLIFQNLYIYFLNFGSRSWFIFSQ